MAGAFRASGLSGDSHCIPCEVQTSTQPAGAWAAPRIIA